MIMCIFQVIGALAALLLLVPDEARSVREEAGDDVRQLVAVDVVGEHVGAAEERVLAATERHRVELPRARSSRRRRAVPTSRCPG